MDEKLQLAYDHFGSRDLAGAERVCNEILAGVPYHPEALHLLGMVQLMSGNALGAVRLIGRALDNKPRDAAILESLGLAHLAQGDGAAAEAAFNELVAAGAGGGLAYLRLGMAQGLQGRLAEAERTLRVAVEHAPEDPGAHFHLGNALAGQGRMDEALASFERVAALLPEHVDALYNIAGSLKSLGRLEEAEAAYERVLQLDPGNPDVLNNLGIVHEQLGRIDRAAECYRGALARDPGYAPALSNLANALRLQGRLDEAATSCERALALRPDFVDALINLGSIRVEQQRLDEAQALFEQALRADPAAADAGRNLGMLFRMQGRMQDALASYRRAVRAAPGQAAGHSELADALRDNGEFDPAVAAYRRALELDPRSALAHHGLAETLKVLGRFDESMRAYEQALAIRPDHVPALNGLIHIRQHLCLWDGLDSLWERLRRVGIAGGDGSVSPFSVLSMPTTAEEHLACAGAWARKHVEPCAAARSTPGFDFSARRRGDRLRIGYLSWGFHQHATAYWAAELFELHDRNRCQAMAYDYGPDDGSPIRERIRGACDRFVELSALSHAEAARRIHDDGVDVLVDLTGYTLGSRPQILALRPAPVQVSWFYPGTMGAACMDYFIADPFVVPPGLERHFSEKIARLPDCYMITDRRREVSDRNPTREDCGLPAGGFVFCCFNQAYKILPETFSLWMRLLQAVPGSVLWLAEANRWQVDNLRREAAARGVAGERLVFAARKPLSDYMAQYRLADLALDTFPYTSHTTAADALWMGCPLVTCPGETFASRVAGSVLVNAGLRDLVMDSPGECERRIVELATAPAKLQDIRRRLRDSRDTCPLFDTPRFVRNLESAYDAMFEQRAAD